MSRRFFLLYWMALTVCLLGSAMAQESANPAKAAKTTANVAASVENSPDIHNRPSASAGEVALKDRMARLEGEKRFRTNCGRCHMPPHKFPPRVMAAAIRHMRVRAMITDEDMRLILRYLTE